MMTKTSMYLVDYRINEDIKKYLLKNNMNHIATIKNENLYEEINGHPDIVACEICGHTVIEEMTYKKLGINSDKIVIGESKLKSKYPYDIAYNVVATDKYLIGKIDFVDESIKNIAQKNKLEFINVNQGYSRCSTIPLPNNIFMTSDKNIHDTLINKNIKSYYIDIDDIYLSERYNGFLGGCCSFVNDVLIFFGNIKNSKSYNNLKKILEENNINYVNVNDSRLIDYGSIVKIYL